MGFKWKPSKKRIAEWLESKEKVETDFHKKINQLEKTYNVSISVNKNCNTVYFEKDKKNYRVSTHYKKNKFGEFVNYESFDSADPNPNNINIVTNSRENIIKKVDKILKRE